MGFITLFIFMVRTTGSRPASPSSLPCADGEVGKTVLRVVEKKCSGGDGGKRTGVGDGGVIQDARADRFTKKETTTTTK